MNIGNLSFACRSKEEYSAVNNSRFAKRNAVSMRRSFVSDVSSLSRFDYLFVLLPRPERPPNTVRAYKVERVSD